MAKRTTVLSIQSLQARPTRYEVADSEARGLYIVVQPSGRRSYCVRYRFAGKPKKLTLDRGLTLAQARAAAAAAWVDIERGVDPAAAKQKTKNAAKIAAANAVADTIERWAEEFLREHVYKKTRRHNQDQAEYVFRRLVIPAWRGRVVGSIVRRDIKELVRNIAATRPIMANRVLGHLSKFFRWLVGEDIIGASPCLGIERPAPENARDRILTDAEVKSFWKATDDLPGPFGDIYKLLLLSAARRQEVAEMQWHELDRANGTWTIAAERAKGKLAVVLPLGPLAWSIIDRQPRIAGSDFVFSARRNFSRPKTKLDNVMKPATPWVNHDLRRTARSLLSRARVAADVAEPMLGHLLPGTVRRTYDRFDRLEQKRAGFVSLEREIDLILNPAAAEIIPLRR